MGLTVDRTLNNIENTLSWASSYPIVGTAPALCKILMGTIQTTAASVCGIFIGLPTALLAENYSVLNYSWTHVKHGIGNVAAGALEAIPYVQHALYYYREPYLYRDRQYMKKEYTDRGIPGLRAQLWTGHENKWMPYTSLIESDCYIGVDSKNGHHTRIVDAINVIWDKNIQEREEHLHRKLTLNERMDLAEGAIVEGLRIELDKEKKPVLRNESEGNSVTVTSDVEKSETAATSVPLSPKEKFNLLVGDFYSICQYVDGTGEHGQSYIDNAYAELKAFTSSHPGFELPPPVINDGSNPYNFSGF